MIFRSTSKFKLSFIAILAACVIIFLGLFYLNSIKSNRQIESEKADRFPFQEINSIRYFNGRDHIKNYIKTLKRYMLSEKNAGIMITDLSGEMIFSQTNRDKYFNPASIIKLMTTSMALSRLEPDFKFTSSMMAIKRKANNTTIRKLYFYTDGDPLLRSRDIQMAFNSVRRQGIRTITDTLFVSPLIKANAIHNDKDTKYIINKLIRRARLRLKGPIIIKSFETDTLKIISSRKSPELYKILYEMNAHSINAIADRLGEALGGVTELSKYIASFANIDTNAFKLSSCSGLGENRFTPKQMVEFLCQFNFQMDRLNMPLESVMPAMGVDGSTLGNRLREMKYQGTILAKTGTLIATDKGVSSLAGYINTKKYGLLPFCIMNKNGEVSFFIRQQNKFLRYFLSEINTKLVKFVTQSPSKYWIYSAKSWEKPLHIDIGYNEVLQ